MERDMPFYEKVEKSSPGALSGIGFCAVTVILFLGALTLVLA
jgi:hypothetical protein